MPGAGEGIQVPTLSPASSILHPESPARSTLICNTQLPLQSIGPVIHGYHENPFEVLGPHEVEQNGRRALAVRAYLPEAERAWVVDSIHGATRPMRRIHPAGLYEAVCPTSSDTRHLTPDTLSTPPYQLRVTYKSGETHTMHDPYAFPPMLTEYDLHLLGEGTHWRSYDRLGGAPPHDRRRDRRELCRLGTECRKCSRRWRL